MKLVLTLNLQRLKTQEDFKNWIEETRKKY